MQNRDKLTIGILAHVDAGKTTLSEAILYKCGAIRQAGRVDHGNAFMDTDIQEKERGITIFSGQARFMLPLNGDDKAVVTLLDTPGHVDFSAEMERTLGVLDYAILVISGKDGVQGHTVTLWNLLQRYRIPVFFFINKMDMEGTDGNRILQEIKRTFGTECIAFAPETMNSDKWCEEAAMCDETLMEEYLADGILLQESIAKAIKARNIFPCYAGSALKQEGIDELLEGLAKFAEGYSQHDIAKYENEETMMRIFRITRDSQGERLTHVKILRGMLKVRETVNGEKVNQIRVYSGDRFHLEEQVGPGTVCSLTGPVETRIGQITGDRIIDTFKPLGESVMSYSVILPGDVNVHDVYTKMKQLEEEDPLLHIAWNEEHQMIELNLMGQVQLEVIRNVIRSRFGIEADFGQGHIAYRETIKETVTGAGHYEPLRHYAEVHLLMEPLPKGSGLVFRSPVSSDELDINWQRLIMTHLKEKEHLGTLTGSPITDMRISIAAGRAHDKHTEGGDFRQATYRAVRQGLRKAREAKAMQLLEPWYEYELEIPQEMVGRAMADIQRMGGTFNTPSEGSTQSSARISGKAPASEMKDYGVEVASYTKGYGHLTFRYSGYEQCHNQDEVIKAIGYDCDGDIANTADSVFCEHGAGRIVAWDKADELMHVSYEIETEEEYKQEEASGDPGQSGSRTDYTIGGTAFAEDKELERIFRKTFGEKKEKHKTIEVRHIDSEQERRRKEADDRRRANEARKRREEAALPEYLLVDGYNVIFAWTDLKELADVNMDGARETLIEILSNYQGFRKCRAIAVFDAYRVKGGQRHFERHNGVTVVYTGEAETADTYIERTTYRLAGKNTGNMRSNEEGNIGTWEKPGDRSENSERAAGRPVAGKYRVRVVTSDRLEQMIIMGNNAHRVSAADFRKEIEQTDEEISRMIRQISRKNSIENPNRIVFPERNKY